MNVHIYVKSKTEYEVRGDINVQTILITKMQYDCVPFDICETVPVGPCQA